MSKVMAILFTVATFSSSAASAQENKQPVVPTCQCQKQGTVLSGLELTQAVNQAIANSDVQSAIQVYVDQGFTLDLNQSGAGTKKSETITGLTLVKGDSDFAYIFFDNTTEKVNTFDQEKAEALTDPNTVTQMSLCGACVTTCIAMIPVPALFISCMVLCGGGFC